MSKYTTELRYICESYNTDTPSDNNNVEDIIANAAPKIFDFDYPIFDESYRLTLESTILRHYYTREICCETVGRWKMFLRDRMILIMPKYNLMYKNLQDIQDKLLFTTDMTEDYKGNGSNTNTNTSSGNSTNRTTGSAKILQILQVVLHPTVLQMHGRQQMTHHKAHSQVLKTISICQVPLTTKELQTRIVIRMLLAQVQLKLHSL